MALISLYPVVFLLASAAAPHSHANDLEDLFGGGPSDSGVLFAASAGGSGTCFKRVRRVVDTPCLACFSNDFALGAAVVEPSLPLPRLAHDTAEVVRAGGPHSAIRLAASRSPPASS
jgi:hypothetical protein